MKLQQVDVDIDEAEGQELSKQYEVTSIPTVVFVHNGKEIGRHVGSDAAKMRQIAEPLAKRYSASSLPVSEKATVTGWP